MSDLTHPAIASDGRHRVSKDKEYEMISNRVGTVWATTSDSIKLFIQIFSAIVGGSIWLSDKMSTAYSPKTHAEAFLPKTYAEASDILVLILALLCGTLLWDNKGTWWQWRRRLDAITRHSASIKIPAPEGTWLLFIQNNGTELVASAVMVAAFVLFWWVNPLKSNDPTCHVASLFTAIINWVVCK